jgi:hypothetical protein
VKGNVKNSKLKARSSGTVINLEIDSSQLIEKGRKVFNMKRIAMMTLSVWGATNHACVSLLAKEKILDEQN